MQFLNLDSDQPPSNVPLPDEQPRRGLLEGRYSVLVQIAGLLGTGWIIWLTTVSPRLHRYTWTSLASHAIGYAILAWAFGAAITFGLFFAIPRRERVDAADVTIRTSAAAIWFAPAIILITQLSPAALAASLALVITATRLLYSQWRQTKAAEGACAEPEGAPGMFGENLPAPPLFIKEMAPALSVAFCAQTGAIAILMRMPLIAGVFLAAGAALLTVFAISAGVADADNRRSLPQAVFAAVLTVLLASGLTVGGLSGRVIHHPKLAWETNPAKPHGLVESLRAVLRQLFYGEQPPGLEKAKEQPPTQEPGNPEAVPTFTGEFPEGSFPGVILLPEVRSVPLLVEPTDFHLFGQVTHPVGVPFGGEYWFFRQRYLKPPPNSFHRKGNPTSLSFSTTDHWPLEMEAHQKFDDPIDLSCCTKVRVQIWNADRYPGTVRLDLFAVSVATAYARSIYLGGAPVRSAPDLTRDHVMAVPETLEFRLPPDPIERCGELKVVFRRDPSRADKSARIAIDRFILVP